METVLTIILVFSGVLSAYAERPTNGTMDLRQEWGQLPADLSQYEVFLAVPNCGLIGHEAVLIAEGQEYKGIVFDCAGRDSHFLMIEQGVAAEVDYYFWQSHPNLVGYGIPVVVNIGLHWSE